MILSTQVLIFTSHCTTTTVSKVRNSKLHCCCSRSFERCCQCVLFALSVLAAQFTHFSTVTRCTRQHHHVPLSRPERHIGSHSHISFCRSTFEMRIMLHLTPTCFCCQSECSIVCSRIAGRFCCGAALLAVSNTIHASHNSSILFAASHHRHTLLRHSVASKQHHAQPTATRPSRQHASQ